MGKTTSSKTSNSKKDEDLDLEEDLDSETETETETETEEQETETENESEDEDEEEDETVDSLKEKLESLQARLRKVNRESAQRRRELKELREKSDSTEKKTAKKSESKDNDDEVAELRNELAKHRSTVRDYELREALGLAADGKYSFVNSQARKDALEVALVELKKELADDDEIDAEDVAHILKRVVKKRPHLLGRRQPPDIDSANRKGRDSATDLMIDEDEIATQYGIKVVTKKK